MPIILSIPETIPCTSGYCPLTSPGFPAKLNEDYPNTDITGIPTGSYLKGGTLSGPNEKPLLAPSGTHPPGYSPSFGDGRAAFSNPRGSLSTPQGIYPSTSTGGIAGADQMFTQAIGAVQGIISLLGQLNLKQLIAEKDKEDPGQSSGISPSPGFNEVELTQSGEETTTKFKGTSILTSDDRNTLISEQKDNSKPGEITTVGNSLKSSLAENTVTTIFSDNKPIAEVATNDKTEIILDNPSGNEATSPGTIITAIISLIQSNFISAQQPSESGQFIKFYEQNIEINGHDISVKILKTFDEVNAGGNNLELYSGENKFEFDGQKILFSRLLTNTPHGIKIISNKLDPNNEYQLTHYTNALGELKDYDEILFMTDITTKPGKGPYAGLKINRERMEMFS